MADVICPVCKQKKGMFHHCTAPIFKRRGLLSSEPDEEPEVGVSPLEFASEWGFHTWLAIGLIILASILFPDVAWSLVKGIFGGFGPDKTGRF